MDLMRGGDPYGIQELNVLAGRVFSDRRACNIGDDVTTRGEYAVARGAQSGHPPSSRTAGSIEAANG